MSQTTDEQKFQKDLRVLQGTLNESLEALKKRAAGLAMKEQKKVKLGGKEATAIVNENGEVFIKFTEKADGINYFKSL